MISHENFSLFCHVLYIHICTHIYTLYTYTHTYIHFKIVTYFKGRVTQRGSKREVFHVIYLPNDHSSQTWGRLKLKPRSRSPTCLAVTEALDHQTTAFQGTLGSRLRSRKARTELHSNMGCWLCKQHLNPPKPQCYLPYFVRRIIFDFWYQS